MRRMSQSNGMRLSRSKTRMKTVLLLSTAVACVTPAAAKNPLSGNLLPTGTLSTRGSQIISDSTGQPVRFACVGWNGLNGIDGRPDGWGRKSLEQHLLTMTVGGFNCIRMSWTDAGLNK